MRNKIISALRVAIKHGCDSVVMGAFGTGDFGHPAEAVANMTRSVLLDGQEDWRANGIKPVFIAIRDRDVGMTTWSAFRDAFRPEEGVYVDEDAIEVLNAFYFSGY